MKTSLPLFSLGSLALTLPLVACSTTPFSLPLNDAGRDSNVSDASSDSSTLPDSQVADATIGCSGCANNEACLIVNVQRGSDSAKYPWNIWPNEADGNGTLILGISKDGQLQKRISVPDTNFADIVSTRFSLGCVGVGALTLQGFLDDNNNATAPAVQSSDYRDFCAEMRTQTINTVAGQTTEASYVLANSCD